MFNLASIHTTLESLLQSIHGVQLDPKLDTILVTGSCVGIGAKLCDKLTSLGCTVVGVDNQPACPNPKVYHFECDLGSKSCVLQACEAIKQQGFGVSVLINTACLSTPGDILTLDPEEFRKMVDINLLAPMFLCRQWLPYMHEKNRGYIVNLSSCLALSAPANIIGFASSVNALTQFHEALSAEIGAMHLNSPIKMILFTCYRMDEDQTFDNHNLSEFDTMPNEDINRTADLMVESLLQGKRGEIICYNNNLFWQLKRYYRFFSKDFKRMVDTIYNC